VKIIFTKIGIVVLAGIGIMIVLFVLDAWAMRVSQNNYQTSPISPSIRNGSSASFDPASLPGVVPVNQEAGNAQTDSPVAAPSGATPSGGESPEVTATRCDTEAKEEIKQAIVQGDANAEAASDPQIQEYQNSLAQSQRDETTMISNTSQVNNEPSTAGVAAQGAAMASDLQSLTQALNTINNMMWSDQTAITTLESNLQQEENNIQAQAEGSYAMLYQECLNK
jgi:hypothetical protein